MFHRIFLLYGDVTTDGKWLRVILILHMGLWFLRSHPIDRPNDVIFYDEQGVLRTNSNSDSRGNDQLKKLLIIQCLSLIENI